jgi:hypothetical protein
MSDRGALEPAQAADSSPQEEVVAFERPTAEQPAVEPVEVQQELEHEPVLVADPSADLAERIRQSEALPAGLRSRLAELVLAKDTAAAEAAVRAVEASLPGILRIGGGEVTRQEHPAGEAFFHGNPEQMAEAEAEQIARGQLARSGLLRGQRAKAE